MTTETETRKRRSAMEMRFAREDARTYKAVRELMGALGDVPFSPRQEDMLKRSLYMLLHEFSYADERKAVVDALIGPEVA